jgi:hypothetical protein
MKRCVHVHIVLDTDGDVVAFLKSQRRPWYLAIDCHCVAAAAIDVDADVIDREIDHTLLRYDGSGEC